MARSPPGRSASIAWPGWRSGRPAGRGAVRPIPARVTGPPRHRWNLPTRARWPAWTTAASICRWPAARCPRRPSIPNLLDPTRGLREGSASLTRKYPLLGKMGSYTITAQTWLIDDKWQYQRMGMGEQLAAANSRVVRAGRGPRVAGEFLRAVGVGDRPGAVPSATGAAGQRSRFHLLRLAFRLGRRSRFLSAVPTDVYDRSHPDRPGVQQLIDRIQGNQPSGRAFPVWPK